MKSFKFLSIFESVKSKLLVMLTEFEFVLIDLTVCVSSGVKFFDTMSAMTFSGEAISSVNF